MAEQVSFFSVKSKIANYIKINLLSRSRTVGDKQFLSLMVTELRSLNLV